MVLCSGMWPLCIKPLCIAQHTELACASLASHAACELFDHLGIAARGSRAEGAAARGPRVQSRRRGPAQVAQPLPQRLHSNVLPFTN